MLTTSDYRLTFAGPDFEWAGERRPGLPLLRWPDGSLCEPVLAYFGFSVEVVRVRIGSMKPEAYTIREWLVWLANRNVRWDRPTDALLRLWRASHFSSSPPEAAETRLAEAKVHRVFNFYRQMPDALPLDERGMPRAAFVGPARRRDGTCPPLTSKIFIMPGANEQIAWIGAERVQASRAKRHTPDVPEVAKILNWLRSKADRRVTLRAGAAAAGQQAGAADRDWLVARTMADGGLRADEVANLSLDSLAKALRSQGIHLSATDPDGSGAGWHPLDGTSQADRNRILGDLEKLRGRHVRNLFVPITGKGGKQRHAAFKVDLVRDLLTVGVWDVRRAQVREWAALGKAAAPPATVFLSGKTRRRLTAGAIGDIMKQAFTEAQVEGSGHRLRAHYATMMAESLWEECFAINGFRYDQAIENMVLDRLADTLGHASVTTSVRYYVDLALLKHFGISKQSALKQLKGIWGAICERHNSLTERKMQLVVRMVEALSEAPEGADLDRLIELALELNPGTPRGSRPCKAPPPWLRLVDG